jgi:hypothetical protein
VPRSQSFGILKKRINSRLALDSDDSAARFIKRIFHNMKQALVEENVRNAFIQIGVRHNMDVVPYRLIFDEPQLQQES